MVHAPRLFIAGSLLAGVNVARICKRSKTLRGVDALERGQVLGSKQGMQQVHQVKEAWGHTIMCLLRTPCPQNNEYCAFMTVQALYMGVIVLFH